MMLRGYQIRAARALLDWSVKDLVDHTGLSASTIKLAEQHPDRVGDDLVTIVAALRAAGVEMVRQGDRFGVVLRERH